MDLPLMIAFLRSSQCGHSVSGLLVGAMTMVVRTAAGQIEVLVSSNSIIFPNPIPETIVADRHVVPHHYLCA